MKTEITVDHMHAAALLYRKARAVLYANTSDQRSNALDELENAVYQYEESLQWETVRLHEVHYK